MALTALFIDGLYPERKPGWEVSARTESVALAEYTGGLSSKKDPKG